MNISSAIVKVPKEHSEGVINEINKIGNCEFQLYENGKIIVTIEGKSTEEEIAVIRQLQGIPKVSSAEMVYSYSEKHLEELRENMELGSVPEALNDDTLTAEKIKYSGDLKKKL